MSSEIEAPVVSKEKLDFVRELFAKQGEIFAQLTRDMTQLSNFVRQSSSGAVGAIASTEPHGGGETATIGAGVQLRTLYDCRQEQRDVILETSARRSYLPTNFSNPS